MADKPVALERAKLLLQLPRYPWNPNPQISGTRLDPLAGRQHMGISLAPLPPSKASIIYHAHHCEEEWLSLLSGSGMAEIEALRLKSELVIL